MLVVVLTTLVVVAPLTLAGYRQRIEAERRTIEAVAALKTNWLATWFAERVASAGLAATSFPQAELYRAWREGDAAALDRLQTRLRQFADAGGFSEVDLLDEAGRVLWSSGATLPGSDHGGVDRLWPNGAPPGEVAIVAPYRDEAGRHHLGVAVALPVASPVAPVVVFHNDPDDLLPARLRAWAVPSASGTITVVRRSGDRLEGFAWDEDEARVAAWTADRADPQSLAAAAVAAGGDRVARPGIDHRGVAAIGAARPVDDTGWYLVAQKDRREVRAAGLPAFVAGGFAWPLLALLSLAALADLRRRQRRVLALHTAHAEAERQRAMELLAAIADASPDAIFAKDLAGRYLFFNRAAAEIVGRPVDTVLGRDDGDLFTADDAAWIMANDRRLAAEGRAETIEEHVHTALGPRDFQAIKGPLRDGAGAVIGVFGVTRDVTERRALEREARAAEQRFRLLIEHAPAALAMFDRDMRYLAVSRRWVADYRLEGVPLVGRSHYEVFPEIPDRWRAVHRRALAGEVVNASVDAFERPDGHVMWLRWEVRPWSDPDGAIQGVVVFTEDITDVVTTRDQLLQLSRAVEQSPESIVITDLDGRIEYVNGAFARVSGYARQEVIGRNPRILASGRTPRTVYDDMWATLRSGETWHGEFHNRRKHGGEYLESATISPIVTSDGVVTHYVAVKEDITEQRRIEQELLAYRRHLEELVAARTSELQEATARAEAANRAKSAFLANMSHEIRTPLNAVVGLTHLLQRDDPTPAQRKRLTKVASAAGHLLSIVNDVLDLAKIEAGRVTLDDQDFHLSAVLDHVRSMISEAARAKGLALEMDGDAVPVWLRGDPVRLRQALLNLAGNAVKFTEAGRVALRTALIGSDGDDLRVRFEVEDTGIGIAPDVLPNLFQPFVQGDASVTRVYGGSGLGLVIAQRLAELMGGEVGVDSSPGRGTRVWFTACLRRGRETPRAVGDGADAVGVLAGRVLLVEDHPVNREVAEELLRGFGLHVDVAENGRVAVERAAAVRYDVVLMDVQMPVLDGLSATRELRGLPGYDRVPILAMTANVFAEDRAACMAAGMDDFVAKPVDPTALRAVLAAWLTRAVPRVAVPSPPEPADAGVAGHPWLADGRLDGHVGLGAVGGDVERYLALLRRFQLAHADDGTTLRADLAAGGPAVARQRANALRGVAEMLGVRTVAGAARTVEQAIAAGRATDDALDELDAALDDLAAWVAAIVGAVRPTAEWGPDEPLESVVERLTSLLAAADTDAVAVFAGVRRALRARHGAAADAVARALERFDFEAALAIVRGWRAPAAPPD